MLLIPAFVHPAALRLPGLGAGHVHRRRPHRSARRPDRPPRRPEDHARRVARSDGRQAAAGHDVRVLTLPGIGSANQLPLWFTVLVISRDVAIVADRRGRQPGGRAAHVPAVDLRQDRHRDLHPDRRRHALLQLPGPAVGARRPRSSTRRWRSRSSRRPTTLMQVVKLGH